MTPEDLAVLDTVKSARVKRVPKTASRGMTGVPDDVPEPRAWSMGGNVD